MGREGFLLKDFKRFVSTHSETIKAHAEAMANRYRRPFIYLDNNATRKEDEARRLAQRDGITRGLVCVFRAVEGCQSFKGRARRRQASTDQRPAEMPVLLLLPDRPGVRADAYPHPVLVPAGGAGLFQWPRVARAQARHPRHRL